MELKITPMVSPRNGKRARTHLVQHRPEREQVGAGVEFLPSHLLRRHVGDGAQRTAGTGQMFLGLDGRGAQGNALRLQRDLRQPEVENLRLPSIRHEDVRGLDVPMDDPLRVCGIQRVGDLDAQIEHRFDLQRLASDPVPERLPLQQFHGDEGSPIGLVNLVDRADVRVVQRGCSLSFPLEAAESLCVVGEFVGKELQGDVATELEVFRLVHHTHTAAADLAEDAVMGNRLTHGLGGRGHWVDMLGGAKGKVNVRAACKRVVGQISRSRRALPCMASRPSQTMSGRITKAAIGSAHFTCQIALIASPAKAISDR